MLETDQRDQRILTPRVPENAADEQAVYDLRTEALLLSDRILLCLAIQGVKVDRFEADGLSICFGGRYDKQFFRASRNSDSIYVRFERYNFAREDQPSISVDDFIVNGVSLLRSNLPEDWSTDDVSIEAAREITAKLNQFLGILERWKAALPGERQPASIGQRQAMIHEEQERALEVLKKF